MESAAPWRRGAGRGLGPTPHGFLWSRRAGDSHPMSVPFPGARPLPPAGTGPRGFLLLPAQRRPLPGLRPYPGVGTGLPPADPRGQRLPSPPCSEVGFREPGLVLKLAPPLTRCATRPPSLSLLICKRRTSLLPAGMTPLGESNFQMGVAVGLHHGGSLLMEASRSRGGRWSDREFPLCATGWSVQEAGQGTSLP